MKVREDHEKVSVLSSHLEISDSQSCDGAKFDTITLILEMTPKWKAFFSLIIA